MIRVASPLGRASTVSRPGPRSGGRDRPGSAGGWGGGRKSGAPGGAGAGRPGSPPGGRAPGGGAAWVPAVYAVTDGTADGPPGRAPAP
ncbi:hypothetical protein ACSNOD_18355 [Streptomyces sp. URMC 123]